MNLQKLGSRKFLVTLFSLVTALAGADLDPIQLGIVGAIATVYVVVEGLVDRKRAESVAADIQRGIELGRGASKEAS